MKCVACQSENRDGVKFCEECGTHIAVACPRCDSRIPVGKKFCGECGQKLAAEKADRPERKIDYSRPDSYTPKFMAEKILTTRSSLEGERKLVTVFFCDVAGFTALSEKLDPETVHEIMDGCFKILMAEIHKYEGTINQFTGDGVMALFGAPLSHEDHAQRACHAALAIQAALVSYGDTVQRRYGAAFKMRIGLNSGPVVVGAIGDDLRMDYTAVGDTTNLAARMESQAEPGGILLSESTFRLVETFFRVESLGNVRVKGKSRPQAIYKLLGTSDIQSRLEASKSRGLIRHIGRKDELHDLKNLFEKARDGRGQVVGIMGEAGVGKSRFVLEMRRGIDAPFGYMESRCLQYNSNIPFLPILDSVKSYFELETGESPETADEKLKDRLAELDPELMSQVPAFRHFLSLPSGDPDWEALSPKDKRIRIFEALRNFYIGLSRDIPLVLVVDDLQWLDKTSEEFIHYLIDWIPRARILLLLLFRQEYEHLWGGKTGYNQIGLAPLSRDESRRFIHCLMPDGDIDAGVAELILDRTSGNPLFMEELTRSLMENRTIIRVNGRYRLSGEASGNRVPDTIQGIIAGRMDRLEENTKLTMQMASVIGRSFIVRLLRSVTGLNEGIRGYLRTLQRLEFIYEKQVLPELEFIFKNIITQEVAYNSLLLNRRREIHGRIGLAILEMYPEQLEEFYEVMAFHFSRSDLHEKAVTYLTLAGDKAIRNNSAWEAYSFYTDALEILEQRMDHPEDTKQKQQKLALLHAMMSPMILLDFPEESLALLEAGAAVSRELDDPKSLVRFYGNIGFYHLSKGRNQEGIRFSGKAFAEATRMNDLTAMAQTAPDLCLSNFMADRYKEVIRVGSTMIRVIEAAGRESDTFGGPAQVFPTLHTIVGCAKAHMGQFEDALAQCRTGLDWIRESTNLFSIGICRYYTGIALVMKGDWKGAEAILLKCLADLEKVKFTQVVSVARGELGLARAFLGDPAKGAATVLKGLEMLRDAGAKWQVSTLLGYAGICYHLADDPKAARDYLDQSLASAVENAEPLARGAALIWSGRVAGDPAEAERHISRGRAILEELGAKPEIAKAHLFMGERLIRDRNAAAPHLEKAAALFREMDMAYWLKTTENLLNPEPGNA